MSSDSQLLQIWWLCNVSLKYQFKVLDYLSVIESLWRFISHLAFFLCGLPVLKPFFCCIICHFLMNFMRVLYESQILIFVHICCLCCLPFFKMYFKSSFPVQCGAWTHGPEVESRAPPTKPARCSYFLNDTWQVKLLYVQFSQVSIFVICRFLVLETLPYSGVIKSFCCVFYW